MKTLSILTALLVPTMAFAYSYDATNLPYADAPTDLETRIALDLLTDVEVIQGNDDGTFAGTRVINRAEFVTIMMRLHDHGISIEDINVNCFPDVPQNEWYTVDVCIAKSLGIVEGEQGFFSPTRPINYVEAVKVLVELFNFPIVRVETDTWYDPYLRSADAAGLLLTEVSDPGHFISRKQMVMLTAAFLAYENGELEQFRAAQRGEDTSSSSLPSSSSLSPQSSSAVSPSSSSSTEISSSASAIYDTHGSVEMAQSILLLGEVSPVLASVEIFSDAQPIRLTEITVTLSSAVNSIDSLLLYDENKRYLGRASLSTGTKYIASVRTQNIEIPKRVGHSIYVRAQLKPYNSGGVGGEVVTVSSIGIVADGVWNNKEQTQSSTETFLSYQTARSQVLSIQNADTAEGVLVEGTGIPIGSFRFAGEKGDGQADLAVTDINFHIGSIGGVTVANVELGADGTNERMSCSVASSTITCSSIDAQYGSFEDRDRILTLYADVTVPSGSINTGLQISINQPGSPSSGGDITWTDGTTSFTWVPYGNPVARGTYYK